MGIEFDDKTQLNELYAKVGGKMVEVETPLKKIEKVEEKGEGGGDEEWEEDEDEAEEVVRDDGYRMSVEIAIEMLRSKFSEIDPFQILI